MPLTLTLFKSKDCPLCRQMEPVFQSVAENFKDKISSNIVDITENMQQAIDNGVMSIPTVIIARDGNETARFTGIVSKEKISQAIEKNK